MRDVSSAEAGREVLPLLGSGAVDDVGFGDGVATGAGERPAWGITDFDVPSVNSDSVPGKARACCSWVPVSPLEANHSAKELVELTVNSPTVGKETFFDSLEGSRIKLGPRLRDPIDGSL